MILLHGLSKITVKVVMTCILSVVPVSLLGGHAPVIKFVDKETLLKEKQQQLEVSQIGLYIIKAVLSTCFVINAVFKLGLEYNHVNT